MLVELDVVFADEVVALHARRSGCLAVAVKLPSQHRLADMDAAVVHQIGLDDVMTVGPEYLRHGVTQQVVADMAQMQGFVGVGRRVFDHHRTSRVGSLPEVRIGGDLRKTGGPERAVEGQVQETLDDVERLDFRHVGRHIFAYLGRGGFGRLAASSQQRKRHEGVIALELPAGLLNLQLFAVERTVKRLHRTADRIRNKVFNIHNTKDLPANLAFFG